MDEELFQARANLAERLLILEKQAEYVRTYSRENASSESDWTLAIVADLIIATRMRLASQSAPIEAACTAP